jgi:hypothetical protein
MQKKVAKSKKRIGKSYRKVTKRAKLKRMHRKLLKAVRRKG